MGPARVFGDVSGRPLPDAAEMLAAAGVPVFPCVPGEKRPATGHGFRDATTDPEKVTAWWRRWPGANIGVPTGPTSGLDVVDVDRRASGSGFAGFDRALRAGLVPGWLALVRTPSGGMHAYFPANGSRLQACWQAARAQVDFRGAGGYVLVPPSTVRTDGSRGRYVLIGPAEPKVRSVDAVRLRDFLDPRPVRAGLPNGTARIRPALRSESTERLAGWVAARVEGERNRGLFWAACRLAEAGLAPAATSDALGPAAERAGLPPREIFTTIRSAYRATGAAAVRTRGTARRHRDVPPRPARAETQVLS